MKFSWLPAALFLIFPNCSGSGNLSSNNTRTSATFKDFTEEKIKSGYDLIYNSDSTFVIYQKLSKAEPRHPQKAIDFIIYDLNKNKIIYQNNVQDGSIDWLDKYVVKIVFRHGMAAQGNNGGNLQVQYYDVFKNIVKPVNPDIQKTEQN